MAKINLVTHSANRFKKTGEPKRRPGPVALDPKTHTIAFRITEGMFEVLSERANLAHIKTNECARELLIHCLEEIRKQSVTN